MKVQITFLALAVLAIGCDASQPGHVTNENRPALQFTDIRSDYATTDVNGYGCTRIDKSVLEHILRYGTWLSEKEVHDYYSTTGCTIRGSVELNGKETKFDYDYVGIMRFANGMILGCGRNCCSESYPNCSWDKQDLKGGQ